LPTHVFCGSHVKNVVTPDENLPEVACKSTVNVLLRVAELRA
jgi:hypothetical protein